MSAATTQAARIGPTAALVAIIHSPSWVPTVSGASWIVGYRTNIVAAYSITLSAVVREVKASTPRTAPNIRMTEISGVLANWPRSNASLRCFSVGCSVF